jgi:phosphoglycolate phosphatase
LWVEKNKKNMRARKIQFAEFKRGDGNVKITKNNIHSSKPFITKDSSIIRSILDKTNAPVKNCSLAEAVVKPGKATIEHAHKKSEELYYFTSGTGKMSLNGKNFAVKKGDAVLIPAGTRHKLFNAGRQDLCLLCACAPAYSHVDTLTTENKYKLVIFDFDGTLVDSAPGILATANAMAKLYGEPPVSMKKVTATIGTGLDDFVNRMFPRQVGECGIEEVIKTYRRIYDGKYMQGLIVFPGVKETLACLHAKGIKLAVVSNKLKRYVVEINKKIGIQKYFDAVLGSAEVKLKKPHPFPVNMLVKNYGVKKEETLLVGDSKYDMEAGLRAGVDTYFLTYGYADKKEVKKFRPKYVSGKFAGIKELF